MWVVGVWYLGISGVEACPRRLRPEGMAWLRGAFRWLREGDSNPGSRPLVDDWDLLGGGGTGDVIGGYGLVSTDRCVCVVCVGSLREGWDIELLMKFVRGDCVRKNVIVLAPGQRRKGKHVIKKC